MSGLGQSPKGLRKAYIGRSVSAPRNSRAGLSRMCCALAVSSLVVNQASSFIAGGLLTNGFAPTTTLAAASAGQLDFREPRLHT